MLGLRWQTPRAWVDAVLADFVAFLQDHAANERKVSQSALVLATHYPNRADLVDLALEIAVEIAVEPPRA
jgi:tRNA-(ms[2]io[6]A)-hydroxylase